MVWVVHWGRPRAAAGGRGRGRQQQDDMLCKQARICHEFGVQTCHVINADAAHGRSVVVVSWVAHVGRMPARGRVSRAAYLAAVTMSSPACGRWIPGMWRQPEPTADQFKFERK